MFILFIICFILSLILWVISIMFNDIEDGLQYYYNVSIFDWIPKDSWWSWYMMDPDDTWKRKYIIDENGVIIGRKKWFGIPVPALFLDGWHGAKFIRQIFQYLTWFAGLLSGIFLLLAGKATFLSLFFLFFIAFTLFGITNHLTHEVYVFKDVLKKEWWKSKEDKIKEWLAKHFGKNS